MRSVNVQFEPGEGLKRGLREKKQPVGKNALHAIMSYLLCLLDICNVGFDSERPFYVKLVLA
jgi:hypothetical protein